MMLDQRTRLSDKVAIVTGAGATGSGDFAVSYTHLTLPTKRIV